MKRHGKAVEPQPSGEPPPPPPVATPSAESAAPAAPASAPAKPPEPTTPYAAAGEPEAPPEETSAAEAPAPATRSGDAPPVIELGPPSDGGASGGGPDGGAKGKSGPMEAILSGSEAEAMGGAGEGTEAAPPHLTAPPYVHHFDSYSLVKQLSSGGLTAAQAITAMKAVRALLAQNLDVAQAGLVGKSAVENEAYLFKAACSELAAEAGKARRLADEATRAQRAALAHEVDVAAQTLNQELLSLTDAVRGMFNDRKMAVREEQKAAESAVSFCFCSGLSAFPHFRLPSPPLDATVLPLRADGVGRRNSIRG